MGLNNSQYDALMREYQERQFTRANVLAKRKEEVCKKYPRLKEIENEISTCSVQITAATLKGEKVRASELKQKREQLNAEHESLIETIDFPNDYLNPPYVCNDCKDTGFIGNERCHCFVQKSLGILYSQSNLGETVKNVDFSDFKLDYYSNNAQVTENGQTEYDFAKKALLTCQDFVNNFKQEHSNLLLFGPTGVGKTFLSNCIAKQVIEAGNSVLYFTAFELFDIFEKNSFDRDKDMASEIENILDCDLLIIDDLGTEMSNTFTVSKLFLVINERLIRDKSTVISTNLSVPDLMDNYSERIFSRITSRYIPLKIYGRDIRIQKRMTQK